MVLETPIGGLTLDVEDDVVTRVRFGAMPGAGPVEGAAAAQLTAYFAGELTEFTVPVEIREGSDFERAVWDQIAAIPYGRTVTYGTIAATLGDSGAARAVGTACNRNPVPVIVPCHRVVGAGGKLVGFGGGLDRKRHLLELEARVILEREWS
jgi:methylated-DNA-[protein]-cysteine S-methyltransferase